MTSLSTHVLDTTHGRPAAGVAVRLAAADGTPLFAGVTDADGRCSGLPTLAPGRYALAFAVAAYFRSTGVVLPDPPFLDIVTVDFGIADGGSAGAGHYHVPLLVSPFGYATYRGS
ncbi:MAG TPA: hydroxyisourate hydrolase [Sphingomonas sp.]|jgi:5-hydroxyisourate hydrolase|nr:hydroxyisourate hydrolase [Sphingomonas sp.]